eukprot:5003923-Pyramimonas_sp.AAC.1
MPATTLDTVKVSHLLRADASDNTRVEHAPHEGGAQALVSRVFQSEFTFGDAHALVQAALVAQHCVQRPHQLHHSHLQRHPMCGVILSGTLVMDTPAVGHDTCRRPTRGAGELGLGQAIGWMLRAEWWTLRVIGWMLRAEWWTLRAIGWMLRAEWWTLRTTWWMLRATWWTLRAIVWMLRAEWWTLRAIPAAPP